MTSEEIALRIRFAYAKGRNIIYYRTLDQQLRPRATYIHVIRGYRKYLLNLLEIVPDTVPYYEVRGFFKAIVAVIDPKVKTEECTQTIINIQKIYENYGK